MLNSLKKFFTPPNFAEDEQTRRAEFLHFSSILVFVFTLVLVGVNLLYGSPPNEPSTLLLGVIALLQILIQWMLRAGHVKAASFVLLALGWTALTGINLLADGVHDEGVFGYVFILLASGYLLGWRIAIAYTFASITAIWCLALLETNGIIYPMVNESYQIAIYLTVIFSLIVAVVYFLIKSLSKSLETSRIELAERKLIEAEREELIEKLSAEIAERERVQGELEQLARTDPLTSLYNRRYFFEIAEKEFTKFTRYNRPLSVVMFDLDRFKEVNDTYGHPVGDLALIHFSELLRQETREPDISARYGGEEFITLLPETENANAYVFAERLRKMVEKSPLQHGKDLISLSVSAGVSGTTGNGNLDSLGDLILQIDQALYRAKRMGRNRVVSYVEESVEVDKKPYTIAYLEEEGIIEIVNTGKLTYKDLSKQSLEAIELGLEKKTNLMFVDDSSLDAHINVKEIYSFPDLWEKYGAPRKNRLAVLVSKNQSLHEDFKYFEIVCLERGWNIRLFDIKEDAMAWLILHKQAVLEY